MVPSFNYHCIHSGTFNYCTLTVSQMAASTVLCVLPVQIWEIAVQHGTGRGHCSANRYEATWQVMVWSTVLAQAKHWSDALASAAPLMLHQLPGHQPTIMKSYSCRCTARPFTFDLPAQRVKPFPANLTVELLNCVTIWDKCLCILLFSLTGCRLSVDE